LLSLAALCIFASTAEETANITDDQVFVKSHLPVDIRNVIGSIDNIVGKLTVNNTFVNNNFTMEKYVLLAKEPQPMSLV